MLDVFSYFMYSNERINICHVTNASSFVNSIYSFTFLSHIPDPDECTMFVYSFTRFGV